MSQPFRWNLQKREQLGTLISEDGAKFPTSFHKDLMQCCAKTLSLSDNATLVFIGRSPESLFDYLSGVLLETSWIKRLTLVNFSMRYYANRCTIDQQKCDVLRAQFRDVHLTPSDIISAENKIAFVDLVYTGETLGNLSRVLLEWAAQEHLDIPALKRKIGFIGITSRTKTSPKTWRWQQHVPWIRAYRPNTAKNVSISSPFWSYLGDTQAKTSRSNPPWRWGADAMQIPSHEEDFINGLNIAYDVLCLGQHSRQAFIDVLVRQVGMKKAWFRDLVTELQHVPSGGTAL